MSALDLSTPVVGATITLRVGTPVGDVSVVGVVVAVDADRWSIRRRDGIVTEVDVRAIQARRDVPPSPAQRASVAEVQQVGALGWRALETARLGDWLLRAGEGFTGRANSALAIGNPGRPLPEALATVEAWYAEKGLPPGCSYLIPARPQGCSELLTQRGYGWSPPVHVMTAELGHVLRAADARSPRSTGRATRRRARRRRGSRRTGATVERCPQPPEQILANHLAVVFASVAATAIAPSRWPGSPSTGAGPGSRRSKSPATTAGKVWRPR